MNGFVRALSQAFGFGRPDDAPRAWDEVKLIHADELREWERFERYQDVVALTYGEYRAGRAALWDVTRRARRFIAAADELAELDTDAEVEYDAQVIDVPRSGLRRDLTLPLERQARPGTRVETSLGRVVGDAIEVPGRWREQRARVRYLGPSSLVHRERIDELRERLEGMTPEQEADLEEARTSRFAHPVVFVSHRWETTEHPDPDGHQLEKLKVLKDCWVVYDFSSFPQAPMTEAEHAELRRIISHMDRLVKNVIVLQSPDYLTRGWCLYEYLVASLTHQTVCDEIGADPFCSLRDWAATRPPVPWTSPVRDSVESEQLNDINDQILHWVQQIVPAFRTADFTVEADRHVVRGLLIDHLQRRLPAKKEHQLHLGEWKSVPWTREELEAVVDGRARVSERAPTTLIAPFRTKVPGEIAAAVAGGYEIRRMTVLEVLNPFGGHLRSLTEFLSRPLSASTEKRIAQVLVGCALLAVAMVAGVVGSIVWVVTRF